MSQPGRILSFTLRYPGVDVPVDLVEQLRHRAGDADRDTALDRVACRARASGASETPAARQLGVEHGGLERGLRHRVTLHARQAVPRRRRPTTGSASSSGPRNSRMTACAPPTHSDA